MTNLMIVESPNKVKKIASILGSDWIVKASVGHIRDLPEKGYGHADNYQPVYELTDRGADVVKGLKYEVAKATEVFLATDPDREGEAIAWHLKEALGLKNPKRATFTSITAPAITAALKGSRSIDFQLVRAQEARRLLDRLVGYKVSPRLSTKAGEKLSAGRVQSPAVRLVVDRERAIQAFKPIEHFYAVATFDGGLWSAKLDVSNLVKEGKYLLDHEMAKRATGQTALRVESSETKPARQAPPAPFTTSTLIQAATRKLKLKPDQTMDIAQALFAAGHITYHRTDAPVLSDEAVEEIRRFALGKWELPATPRKFKVKGDAQGAHEAIRPTHIEIETAGENETERAVYDLIRLRAIGCQLADAETMRTTLVLEVADTEDPARKFKFKAVGSVPIAAGWKALFAKADEDDEEEKAEQGKVPPLEVGSLKTADKIEVKASSTEPPKRFDQASLVKELEDRGIGRPSTYAAIMSNIVGRGYVRDEKGKLLPSKQGEMIVDNLVGSFSFIEYEYTRAMEERLDDIADGNSAYQETISAMDAALEKELSCLPEAITPKPSEKQIAFAQKLASESGIPIPEGSLDDSRKLSAWIDGRMAAQPVKPASPAQISMIDRLISEKKVKAPAGHPDKLSMKDASAFIDKHFKKKGKK